MKEYIYKKYYEIGKDLYSANGDVKLKNHAKHVKKISEIICTMLKLKSSLSRTIQLGAYLHDIGKTRTVICNLCSAKEHNILGAQYLDKFLEDDVCSREEKILKNIIKYHRGDMPKKEIYKDIEMVLAINIVRTADKLASNFKDIETLKRKIEILMKVD